MTMQVLHDNILILKESISKNEITRASGVVLAQSQTKAEYVTANVYAAGSGYYENGSFINNPVKNNDNILFNIHQAVDMTFEGKEYKLINSRNIIAII